MLDGWYCRSMANQQSIDQNDHDDQDANIGESDTEDDSQGVTVANLNPRIDYKGQYNSLKKKLKFLLYENEFFQDALRSSQRRLLKVTRDRSFLLDRLLQYEKPEITSSESEDTESSDDDSRTELTKKRKLETSGSNSHNSFATKQNPPKRKKPPPKKTIMTQIINNMPSIISDGHMTAEQVERHLQSRQSLMEMVPERAPATVPNEMFSNEPSLDSESNDQMIETSPSNIGDDCLSMDMNIMPD